MENKKIIEGYVASLTMATMPLFKEATKKIQDGEILSVTFTINDKSRFSRIVVNEKKTGRLGDTVRQNCPGRQ